VAGAVGEGLQHARRRFRQLHAASLPM
jgi:hypothetical protein